MLPISRNIFSKNGESVTSFRIWEHCFRKPENSFRKMFMHRGTRYNRGRKFLIWCPNRWKKNASFKNWTSLVQKSTLLCAKATVLSRKKIPVRDNLCPVPDARQDRTRPGPGKLKNPWRDGTGFWEFRGFYLDPRPCKVSCPGFFHFPGPGHVLSCLGSGTGHKLSSTGIFFRDSTVSRPGFFYFPGPGRVLSRLESGTGHEKSRTAGVPWHVCSLP